MERILTSHLLWEILIMQVINNESWERIGRFNLKNEIGPKPLLIYKRSRTLKYVIGPSYQDLQEEDVTRLTGKIGGLQIMSMWTS